MWAGKTVNRQQASSDIELTTLSYIITGNYIGSILRYHGDLLLNQISVIVNIGVGQKVSLCILISH